MAWSWSHTDEAYTNARANLEAQELEWLQVCWAEIQAGMMGQLVLDRLNLPLYTRKLAEARNYTADTLANAIWSFAIEHRTCDNGGYNAHMCPFGCHTVGFSREEN